VALQDVYPDSLLVSSLPGYSHDRKFMANMFYLQEHGFIEGGDIREPGQCRSMVDAQITKDGLDFLANDGGVPGILGLGSVKVDREQIIDAVKAGLFHLDLAESGNMKIDGLVNQMETLELRMFLLGLVEQGAAAGEIVTALLDQK